MKKKQYKPYAYYLSFVLSFTTLTAQVQAMDWSDVFYPDDRNPQGLGQVGSRVLVRLDDKSLGRAAQVSKNWCQLVQQVQQANLERRLREVEAKISKSYEEGTIFLGNTSSGKSTLFNYVQGAPLHGKFKGLGRYEIVFAPGVNTENYSPIGIQFTTSQTTFPVVVDSNFDCPGFKDTRHLQDIVNAYSIYRIVSRTKKLKILLASDIGEIFSAKSGLFLDLIDQVGEIFENDIEALCEGLCLVVTKTNRQQANKEGYKPIFAEMLEEQRKEKPEKETRIDILEFLSQSDRIGFFKMPEAEGLIPNDDKYEILEMLRNTPYQANIKPTLSLSDKSKNAIGTLLSGIFDKMRDVILDLSAKYPEYYEKFITSNIDKNIDKTASELREALEEIPTHLGTVSTGYNLRLMSANPPLDSLRLIKPGELGLFCRKDKLYCKLDNKEEMQIMRSDKPSIQGLSPDTFDRIQMTVNDPVNIGHGPMTVADKQELFQYTTLLRKYTLSNETKNFYEHAKKISSVLEILSHGSRDDFARYRERLEFFKQVGITDLIEGKIREYLIFSPLTTFSKDAETFTKVERSENNPRITGFLLGTSDINKMLKNQTLSKIDLYSLNALLIDEELIHPGLKLTLISPHWWVIGNKKISLKGGTGISHDSVKARDGNNASPHGGDGLPGEPGESGGHFYGKGKVFRGLEKLTIDVSGGKGGKGQRGGNGANGQDGDPSQKYSHKEMVTEALPTPAELLEEDEGDDFGNTMKHAMKMSWTFNAQFKEDYYYYWCGEVGGNGGRGGKGGKGGNKGIVILEGVHNNSMHINNTNGKRGKNGTGGRPGEGGKTVVKKKTYINDRMFETNFFIKPEEMPIGGKIWMLITAPIRVPVALIASPICKAASSHWEGGLIDCDFPPDPSIEKKARDGKMAHDYNSKNIVLPLSVTHIDSRKKNSQYTVYSERSGDNKFILKW